MENKILTSEELKIIGLFSDNLTQEYTIREIMHKTAKKSYNWVFLAVTKLSKLGIINIQSKGNSNFCSINLYSNLTLNYLSLLEKMKLHEKLPLKNINELVNFIPLSYFTFIITGSYANGNFNKKSDLDIVVILENSEDTKRILNLLRNKGELMIPTVHPYVFTKEDFLKMLLSKEENYGNELSRNHILVFGAENYYFIIREAISNGFKG